MSLGILIACFWYLTAAGARMRKGARSAVSVVYGWAYRKYYVDEVVEGVVVERYRPIAVPPFFIAQRPYGDIAQIVVG